MTLKLQFKDVVKMIKDQLQTQYEVGDIEFFTKTDGKVIKIEDEHLPKLVEIDLNFKSK